MISPLASPMRGWRNLTPFRARGRGSSGQFVPQQLGLTALYDANNGGSTTQITDSGGGGLAVLAFGATTAAPTYLAAPGAAPYVYVPAVAGNLVSTPDAAAFAFTGDQDIRWGGAVPDWTPGTNTPLVAQDTAGGRRFSFFLNSAGRLSLVWSADATNGITKTSTVALPLVDGAAGAVRATLDVDDGSTQNVVRFYYKAGATYADVVDNTGWTLLDTVTTAATTSVSGASTTTLRIGSSGTIAANVTSTTAMAYLNGIDGTLVADFDAVLCTQTGYTSASGNVWTVGYATSGLSSVVKSAAANDTAAGVLADGSNDTATGPAAAIPALAAADACTLFCVVRPRATMVADMVLFSTRSGSGAGVTLRMASATTVVADISDGSTTATTPAVTIVPGTRYVLGVVVPVAGGAYCFANNTLGSTVARTGNTETGGALTVFSTSAPASFGRAHARVPYGAMPTAVTTAGLAQLVSFYGGGV